MPPSHHIVHALAAVRAHSALCTRTAVRARVLSLAAFALLSILALRAQGMARRLRVVEYNVENLFDTLHAEGRADMEFTPQGERKWDSRRYWAKLGRISRVLAAAGGDKPAALVALCEVENDSVLSHLTRRTRLARLGYEYAVTHSADPRGVNVALLYQPPLFLPVSVSSLRVPPPAEVHATRDVLHVAGRVQTGDTLDVMVCHLPSQRGGKKAEAYRLTVARAVRAAADSLSRVRENFFLVVTGDFNTTWPSAVFSEGLKAVPVSADSTSVTISPAPESLCMLSAKLHASGEVAGTYKYQGRWEQLDHFAVSASLLSARAGKPHTAPAFCRIADFPFLLRANRGGAVYPYRTYLGPYYQGGYSDHLPLVLDIFL